MAYKISMWIVLFLLFFNGGAVMLQASGAADYLGVTPATGGGERLDDVSDELNSYETGNGGGSTLFGLYNTLSQPLEAAFNAIFPGAQMLKNVGVPGYLVTFLFTGLAVVPGYDLLVFLRAG